MAIENVKKFFELVKSDEELAREIAKIKDEIQNKGETVDYEQIISKKVIPLAKKHGLDFTMEDFLKYTNSMVQQGELSDDDLLNVSGGWSMRQSVAVMGLAMVGLPIVSGFMMGNKDAPTVGGNKVETSISTKAPAATTQEVKSDDNVISRQVMLNTEVADNKEESEIADETNENTENNNFNEEDITQIEQEVNEVADENARTAEKDNKVAEAPEEDDGIEMDGEEIDLSSRLGYEDLDANKTELKDIKIDWSEKDNKALDDFFADEGNDEDDGIEMDGKEEKIGVDDEDFNFSEDFNIENVEKTKNQEEADENNDDEIENNENAEEGAKEFEEVNTDKTESANPEIKEDVDKTENQEEAADEKNDDEIENKENKFMFNGDADESVKNYHMNEQKHEEDQQLWEDAYKENNDDKIENNEEDENKENAEEAKEENDDFFDISQKPLVGEVNKADEKSDIIQGYEDLWNFEGNNAEEGSKEFEEVNTDKTESANPEIKEYVDKTENQEDFDEDDFVDLVGGAFKGEDDGIENNENAEEAKEETKEEVKTEDAEKIENQKEVNDEIENNENAEKAKKDEAAKTEATEKQEYKEFGKGGWLTYWRTSSYSDIGKHIYGEMEKVGFNIDNFSNKEDAVSQIEKFINGVEHASQIDTLDGEFAEGSKEKQQLDKIKESYSRYTATLKRNPDSVEKHTINEKAGWPDRVKKLCDVLDKCGDEELTKGDEPFWQDLEELGGRIGKESGNGFYFNDAWFPKVKTNKNRNDFKQNELKKVKMAYDKYFGSNNN